MRSQTGQTIFVNGVILFAGMITSIMLARWLQPVGRGEVAAAMLWPMLLVTLGSLGLIDAIVYFSASPDAQIPAIIGSSLILLIMQSAFVMPLGYVLMPVMLRSQSHQVVEASRYFLLVIPISLGTQYMISVLQGRLAIQSMNMLRLLMPMGYLAGTVALRLMARIGVGEIVTLQFFLNIAVLLVTLAVLKHEGLLHRPVFSVAFAGEMLRYGAKVHLGGLASQMNFRLDQVLMAAWVAPGQLGLYVAAVSASNLPQIVPLAVRIVGTPSIARHSTEIERVAELKGRFRIFWLLSIAVTMALAIVMPWALPLVYGGSFRGSVIPAEILLLGAIFVGANSVLTGGAQALGRPWLGSKAELAGLLMTISLLICLIPLFGILGAALASTAAYGTTLVVLVRGLTGAVPVSVHELFTVKGEMYKDLAMRVAGAISR